MVLYTPLKHYTIFHLSSFAALFTEYYTYLLCFTNLYSFHLFYHSILLYLRSILCMSPSWVVSWWRILNTEDSRANLMEFVRILMVRIITIWIFLCRVVSIFVIQQIHLEKYAYSIIFFNYKYLRIIYVRTYIPTFLK